jgi:hypothetical protein
MVGACVLVVFWPTVLPGYAALVINEGPADADRETVDAPYS